MADIIRFLVDCARSGTLLASACALAVVPLAAWAAVRFVAPAILRMTDDAPWQAPFAALAASLPGALFLFLAVTALIGSRASACLATAPGRTLFSLIGLAAAAAVARAVTLAIVRAVRVRAFVEQSSPAGPRLSAIATSIGLAAREIATAKPVCVLAGLTGPTAIVSRGALEVLDDRELVAALHHEKAHATRGDQMLAATLSFFVDLLPLPAGDLVKTYRRAREFAADERASAWSHVDDLAGALVRFAKAEAVLAGVAHLAGAAGATGERIRRLLSPAADDRREMWARRCLIAAALAGVLVVGAVVPVSAGVRPASCSIGMSDART